MNIRPDHIIDEGLWDWLQIATKGLCQSVARRIVAEIEAHYDEAVAAHLAEGRSPVGARAMALEQLGDPKKAARNLRRNHLTESDLKYLLKLKESARKGPSWLSALSGIFIAVAIGLRMFADHLTKATVPDLFFLLFLLTNSWFGFIPFLLIRVWSSRRLTRRLVQLQSMSDIVGFALVLLGVNWFWRHLYIYMWIFCIYVALVSFHHARLRQKMRNEPLHE